VLTELQHTTFALYETIPAGEEKKRGIRAGILAVRPIPPLFDRINAKSYITEHPIVSTAVIDPP
jgi:hypothetical protein